MDELWRKAADEYPLNTGGADWDKVAARLGIPPEPKKRKDRRYLLLLLLLLLPWVCIEYANRHETEQKSMASKTPAAAERAVKSTAPEGADAWPDQTPAPSPATDAGSAASGSAFAPEGPSSGKSTIPSAAVPSAKNIEPASGTEGRANSRPTSENVSTPPVGNAARSKVPAIAKQQSKKTGSAVLFASKKASRGNADPQMIASARSGNSRKVKSKAGLPPSAGQSSSLSVGREAPGTPAAVAASTAATATVVPDQPVDSTVARIASPDTASKAAAADLAKSKSDTAIEAPAKTKPEATGKPRGFYAGLLAGSSITHVDGQRSAGAGLDVGIVAGYATGKHLSIEAGLLWSRKHYYSRGELVKSDYYLPRYYTLKDVTGDCRMFEIPVAVYYHFGYGKKGNFFVSAGVSSYLMQREDYEYNLKNTLYNTEYPVSYTYKNATRDWVSQLQLTAGYRRNLGTRLQLRVEPYVHLPLKNAGWGQLPLTSTGLRAVITRNFFRTSK